METSVPAAAWEAMYAPHDPPTYRAVMDQLQAEEIVIDIGAGDLRLARQMARIVRKVYAVEIRAALLQPIDPLLANLIPIHADARELDFPNDGTTGVLLMRHCTCFRLYAEKLRKAGAARLITNARWRMSVEVVDLRILPTAYAEAAMGWYACSCGRVGFKEGPAEGWSMELDGTINEVSDCPACLQR